MEFCLASNNDLPAIMAIIHDAQVFMKPQGSGQWQDGSPSESTIREDILSHRFYVAKSETGIAGVCAVLGYDKDYVALTSGRWIQDVPYLVIHRFAVAGQSRHSGIGTFMIESIAQMARQQGIDDLRADTHAKNLPMIALLEKSGFVRRGEAMLDSTKLRVVFEKILK